ncbi:MAG: caspase family protein [Flavobacteriales bacterium]|nr:caspase family protein [Flavobacteriales bacterium]
MGNNLLFAVGNSRFTNKKEFHDIPYASNDARVMWESLCNSKFSIFQKSKSVLLINSKNSEFNNGFERFIDHAKSDDLLMFYFASHSKLLYKKSFHVAMTDTLADGKSLAFSSFNIEHLIPILHEKEILRYIIVLDTCRSGEAARTIGVRNRNTNTEDLDLVRDLGGVGKIVISSSEYFQPSIELDNLKHGLFSYYFIQALRSNSIVPSYQQYKSIKEVFDAACKAIKANHKDIYQIPRMSGQEVYGDLYIAKNIGFKEITNKNNKARSSKILSIEKSTLVIVRDSNRNFDWIDFEVHIDGVKHGEISNGGTIELEVAKGVHYFQIKYDKRVYGWDGDLGMEYTTYSGTSSVLEIQVENDKHVFRCGFGKFRRLINLKFFPPETDGNKILISEL